MILYPFKRIKVKMAFKTRIYLCIHAHTQEKVLLNVSPLKQYWVARHWNRSWWQRCSWL